jgi:uncharacterized protein (TIGR03437 family)
VALGDDGSVWVAGDTAYPWVVGPGANPSADVFVTQLIPESSAPPDVSAVLNSASLQGTTIAPNQIITVVASGAGSDATLLVNGAALPTISSQNGMIVAQVPADFQAPASVNVGVQSGGRTSAPLVMPGDVAAPAIYTQDGSGTGSGLIFNEDGSLNSADNPATQGSVVSIACNGVGVDSPVHVYVDGALGDLLGATSQALPGLPGNAVILRVRIPTAFSMPPLVSVLLNVGGVGNVSGILSQPYVAIAITSTPR